MPAFSTTTVTDRTTAAVLMMGSMKAYFKYRCCLMCGIPTVTLLGERADYEDILKRLEKLPELGPEASTFADLLRPVLRNFIATFDPEQSTVSHDFWSKIAHHLGGGSGPSYLGGWLTAFCFWNEKPIRIGWNWMAYLTMTLISPISPMALLPCQSWWTIMAKSTRRR